MMDLIVIHGAPGCGKTTVAGLLHKYYRSPWFEFGWIPEFNHKNPHTEISFKEEEAMTFETLMLVVHNYVRHGFQNVLLSDLNDCRILEIAKEMQNQAHIIITLYSENSDVIKKRILTRTNGNEYRDWESAIKLNQAIYARPILPNEYRICSDHLSPEEISAKASAIIELHTPNHIFNEDDYPRSDYLSYTD